MFQANPAGGGFANKSISIADLAPLLTVNGIEIVNLQHGAAGRELAARAPRILDPLPADLPLDDYAAAIAATDLLVTIDTMAAHLAGALGHPLWIAVPHSPHWVWGLGRATPWYPHARIARADGGRLVSRRCSDRSWLQENSVMLRAAWGSRIRQRIYSGRCRLSGWRDGAVGRCLSQTAARRIRERFC